MGNAAITSLSKDPTLTPAMVTKLRAACIARKKHAETFFQSEIFGIAKSISTDSRSLYHGSKSDILKRFEKEPQPKIHGIVPHQLQIYRRQLSKSDILKRFEKKTQPKIHGNSSALVVDLSKIVKIIGQQTFRTFKEFATNVYKHMMSLGVEFKAERIDIVADRYFENSLKGGTRKDR